MARATFWRPMTAIRNGDIDPATTRPSGDATWEPLDIKHRCIRSIRALIVSYSGAVTAAIEEDAGND